MTPEPTWTIVLKPLAELPAAVAVLVGAWAFGVGSVVGSFLNVVIARLPIEGESVVRPRSRCPTCGTMIAWYDNIPIVSWVVLGAKCRQCKTPISIRYPFIEFLTGLCALGVAVRFGLGAQGTETFLFAAILIAIAYIDLDTWTIPWETIWALAGLGLAFGVAGGLMGQPLGAVIVDIDVDGWSALTTRAIGAAAGFGVLWAFAVLSTVYLRKVGRLEPDQEAMGLGDPLLLGGIGMILGWRALPIVAFLASTQGTIVALVLAATGRMHPADAPVEGDPDDWVPPESSVQFGPFLALAGLEVAFFGPTLLSRIYGWMGL